MEDFHSSKSLAIRSERIVRTTSIYGVNPEKHDSVVFLVGIYFKMYSLVSYFYFDYVSLIDGHGVLFFINNMLCMWSNYITTNT